MMRTWSGAWIVSSAPSPTWVVIADTALLHHHQARHKITTLMIAIRPQAPTQGMETIIDLVACMLIMKTLAPTQGEENSIAMLVPMNVLHKNKFYTKIVIKWIAMPTMGVTTNPTTTSSTTWNRHLIVNHMLMLKTKVITIHRCVITKIILAMTNMEEDTRNMIKMRWPSMDVVNNLNNLVKIFNNIIIVNQVKLVFNFNANPMLWLVVEDLLYHLKPQEMKASVLAEGIWKMKRVQR